MMAAIMMLVIVMVVMEMMVRRRTPLALLGTRKWRDLVETEAMTMMTIDHD